MSSPAPSPAPAPRRRRLLGALRHRNYRLFFTGQVISTVGTWMQSIALPWLVLLLTHNDFLVGITLAFQFLPMLLAGPIGGIVADHFPKRRILLVTQTAYTIPALTLFLLTHFHVVQFPFVLAAAVMVGTVNVFDVPARQAFSIEMVGREDLMNAIALNSSVFNGAAVVGPSVAGVIIGLLGVQLCFLINALSFAGTIVALLRMRNLPSVVRAAETTSVWARVREGASYARRDPLVGTMLVMVGVFSLFAMNRLTLIPLFADRVLHIGAAGFGFLMASLGLGALSGALTLALFPGQGSGRRQFVVGVVWSLMLIAFSFSRVAVLSGLLLYGAGFCQMWFLATANTRIQMAAPDSLRGRVMSLYAQAMMGTSPIGSTQAGALSALFGPPVAMVFGAVVAGATVIGVRLWRPAVFEAERAQPQ
ncbi:MAG TPA: MFS transporter [Candidatus Dormibacteraeota bacterium]